MLTHAAASSQTIFTNVAVMQAMTSLEAYEQLGPEMLQIANAHRDIDAELLHAEFTLLEFERVTFEDE